MTRDVPCVNASQFHLSSPEKKHKIVQSNQHMHGALATYLYNPLAETSAIKQLTVLIVLMAKFHYWDPIRLCRRLAANKVWSGRRLVWSGRRLFRLFWVADLVGSISTCTDFLSGRRQVWSDRSSGI